MSSNDEDEGEKAEAPGEAYTYPVTEHLEKIHVQIDYFKTDTSKRWLVADYQELGALSEENRARLAEQFDLPEHAIKQLSLLLGDSLDIHTPANTAAVYRDVAIKRANEILEVVARLAKRVEYDLTTMRNLLAPLSDAFASQLEQRGVLASAQHRTETAQRAASGLHDAIDCIIRLPGSAADMSPTDMRRTSDGRRQMVVESCCQVWHDAGRPVTKTNRADRIRDRRTGPLIKFIQAVAMMVTDPPTKLSGETIRNDIDEWKPEEDPVLNWYRSV